MMNHSSPKTNNDLADNICVTDLGSFIQKSFYSLNPNRPFLPNWHVDAIAEILNQASDSKIKRIIINVPPRYLKSVCISVAWPAWLLGINPTNRIIAASYSQILSDKHSIDCRSIIGMQWYKKLFPNVEIKKDQNRKNKFMTTEQGFRFATSVDGSVTGEGGNFLIVDDPHIPNKMGSKLYRSKVINWFEQTFASRLDDKNSGVIIIVMQRLHEDDLSGHLLRQRSDSWHSLVLPSLSDDTQYISVGKKYFFRGYKQALHGLREDQSRLNLIQKELGHYNFAAQYQQNPVPQNGAIISANWFKHYDVLPTFITVFQSWDTAIKATLESDYSVCTTWGETADGYYLIDVIRYKYEYPALKLTILAHASKWNCHTILIEDKASGQSLIQELKSEKHFNIIPIIPIADKLTRFITITPFFQAGKVFLPNSADWIFNYQTELLTFPLSKNDDQVDSTSQFFNYIQKRDLAKNQPTFNVRLV